MDEDIYGLEGKILRLKADYEQYFQRILKCEPIKQRKEIEHTILRYTGVPINNTSLKFKFSTSVSKFISYKQYWKRTLRMIEEGTYQRRAESGGAAIKTPPTPTKKPASTPAAPTQKKVGIQAVYDRYIKSREDCGQSTKGVTLDKFKKNIIAQQKKLGAEGKGLKVFVKDGKTKIAFTSGKAKKK